VKILSEFQTNLPKAALSKD